MSTSQTRSYIIFDSELTPQARSFHPQSNDISGHTTLRVRVPALPEGGSVRWRIPSGSEGHYQFQGGGSSVTGLAVTLEALEPGSAEVDVAVLDGAGAKVESQKLDLHIPQFVEITSTADFDDVMANTFNLIPDEVATLVNESKEVCDVVLSTANVRTVWAFAPFNQALPPQLRSGQPGSDFVTKAKFEGDPPTESLVGRTTGTAAGVGSTPHNETISVWPGGFDDEVTGGPAEFLDDMTRNVIKSITADSGMSTPQKSRAISIVGRVIGETTAHEIVHSLVGVALSGGGHNSPAEEFGLMNNGSDRSFENRSGFELLAPAETADLETEVIDHGIAVINIPVGQAQTHLDTHFPVPPAFK